MSVEWQNHSPQEIFDALKERPKIASAWLPAWVDETCERWPPCRKTPDGTTIVWERNGVVTIHVNALPFIFGDKIFCGKPINCCSREEADRILRSVGWTLIDKAN